MTHEEIIDAALKVNGNVMWWPMYKDTIYQFAELIAAHEREAWPNLESVINWLENGCDPKEAAKELRLYADAIRARGEK